MNSIMIVEPSLEKRKKANLKVLSAVVLCAVALGIFGTVLSLLQVSRTVPNSGSVKGVGVGVYWDSACTNQTSSINWGIFEPGSNKTVSIYVKNEGNTVVTLSKTVQNWNPVNAANYITLSWNYANQTLNVNQVLQVNLILAVSPSVSGITSFSFDTTIIASG
jgi:hypothetical protein